MKAMKNCLKFRPYPENTLRSLGGFYEGIDMNSVEFQKDYFGKRVENRKEGLTE